MLFNELLGKTLAKITGNVGDDEIYFVTDGGKKYKLFHLQDCCESVRVDDICGELSDLIGSPILQAEENSSSDDPVGIKRDYTPESCTWTFYRIATMKGQVVIRWYGESNGYYSESVSFDEVN